MSHYNVNNVKSLLLSIPHQYWCTVYILQAVNYTWWMRIPGHTRSQILYSDSFILHACSSFRLFVLWHFHTSCMVIIQIVLYSDIFILHVCLSFRFFCTLDIFILRMFHHYHCSVLWHFHTSHVFIIQIVLYSWYFHTSSVLWQFPTSCVFIIQIFL